MTMSLTPEELYLQLGSLVQQMPDLAAGPITNDVNRWLGRATVLVEMTGDLANTATLKVASQNLNSAIRASNAQTIGAIVHTALAKAELAAPAQVQGSFIAAGHVLDAFAAVGKVLRTAATSVMMVDPYADETVVTDYAVLAPEDNMEVRILADAGRYKGTLKPAAERWVKQFGKTRPLEVRLSPAGTLHDRLVIVDEATAWVLGQSFNKLAERSHTSLVRMDPESGSLKVGAFSALWQSANPL